MEKLRYLSIILSFLLINSKISFSNVLKKELGVCGKSMGAILEISPEKEPLLLENIILEKEEFCDYGRYEKGANYKIFLYNTEEKLVYDKSVYLNPLTIREQTNKKTGAFVKTKIEEKRSSRIVKFPIPKEMGEIAFYQIESIKLEKKYDKKKMSW